MTTTPDKRLYAFLSAVQIQIRSEVLFHPTDARVRESVDKGFVTGVPGEGFQLTEAGQQKLAEIDAFHSKDL